MGARTILALSSSLLPSSGSSRSARRTSSVLVAFSILFSSSDGLGAPSLLFFSMAIVIVVAQRKMLGTDARGEEEDKAYLLRGLFSRDWLWGYYLSPSSVTRDSYCGAARCSRRRSANGASVKASWALASMSSVSSCSSALTGSCQRTPSSAKPRQASFDWFEEGCPWGTKLGWRLHLNFHTLHLSFIPLLHLVVCQFGLQHTNTLRSLESDASGHLRFDLMAQS